jgi:enamine deaminase RidA (YjgF/YER057c/UK114 family)
MIERIRPPDLFRDAPYAYASVVSADAFVFAAGACPIDEQGVTVAPGDFEAQAAHAVRNLFATLQAAGSSPVQVLKTTIFVVTQQRSELVRVWSIVRAAFGEVDPPSTLLGVSMLGYPDQLVEIEAVAIANRAG